MNILIKKEFIHSVCSPICLLFASIFSLTTGLLIWLFPGKHNIINSEYPSMDSFFIIAPTLLIILIPILTILLYVKFTQKVSESKNHIKTQLINTLLATCFVIAITLFSTVCYPFTLHYLNNTPYYIDTKIILASYFSLFLLSVVFSGISTLIISICKNKILATAIAILANLIIYFWSDWISTIITSKDYQIIIDMIGIKSHYNTILKGTFSVGNIIAMLSYIIIPTIFSIYIANREQKKINRGLTISILIVLLLNILAAISPKTLLDLSSSKKFILSDYSKNILDQTVKEEIDIQINIFLTGDLNSQFQHLQKSVKEVLIDMSLYSNNKIHFTFINPYSSDKTLNEINMEMEKMNMPGININKSTQAKNNNPIFPYAQIISEKDTISLLLANKVQNNTQSKNLNLSIENLEIDVIDAIRRIKLGPQAIAFIEGHGEIERPYVYDAEELLSKYFFVNRGYIGNDISILNNFKVVIIAGPTQKFNETEKFILDQYIMSGGRVLWLIDGVYLSHQQLDAEGYSPSMRNETNLDDIIFTYGSRINPILLQDTYNTSMLIKHADNTIETLPCSYYPTLLPSRNHSITQYILDIKSQFISSLDTVNSNNKTIKKILLTTSRNTHSTIVPDIIDIRNSIIIDKKTYFNESNITTAMSIEGIFNSAFTNRPYPKNILKKNLLPKKESDHTKMIIIGSSSIIRNQITGYDYETKVMPMGYDEVSGKQFGNREFIVNAVNWLANDNEFSSYDSKKSNNHLNKQLIETKRGTYITINLLFPLLFIFSLISVLYCGSKMKFKK